MSNCLSVITETQAATRQISLDDESRRAECFQKEPNRKGRPKKEKPTVSVGSPEGKIVPGLCAEDPETSSSEGSLGDGCRPNQERKNLNLSREYLAFYQVLKGAVGTYPLPIARNAVYRSPSRPRACY